MPRSRRAWLRRGAAAGAAFVLLVAGYVAATLPPRAVHLGVALPPTVVLGAYHLHSTRSDGTGTPDDIAAAAARAGLRFIVLTDHGDATRPPDPPAYRHGVLVIDAVEVSTSRGHVVALHLPGPAPYPLAGEPRDVVEDIHRLGGWAFIAHPDSPKAALRWSDFDVPYDGIEWLNADSEWRDETAGRLALTLARATFRGPESVASLFARPAVTLARWDAEARRRSVVGVGALDAHAHGQPSGAGEGGGGWLGLPSYETMFRTVGQVVRLDAPLDGDAAHDASRVLDALHLGHTYTVIRAFADPGWLKFSASRSGVSARMGDRLDAESTASTTFRANVPGAPDARITLLRDGRPVQTGAGTLSVDESEPGEYRVEVTYGDHGTPWLVSNPIYVGPAAAVTVAGESIIGMGPVVQALAAGGAWTVEHSPTSMAAMRIEGDALRFDYHLADLASASPFAALVSPAGGRDVREITFVGRADRPMRLSLQVRRRGAGDAARWRRSVYLDATARVIRVPLGEFRPVAAGAGAPPAAGDIGSLLFVVDTLNTAPGARGTVWVSGVALDGPARP